MDIDIQGLLQLGLLKSEVFAIGVHEAHQLNLNL